MSSSRIILAYFVTLLLLQGNLDTDDLHFSNGRKYKDWTAYGQSKLGDLLLAKSVADKTKGTKTTGTIPNRFYTLIYFACLILRWYIDDKPSQPVLSILESLPLDCGSHQDLLQSLEALYSRIRQCLRELLLPFGDVCRPLLSMRTVVHTSVTVDPSPLLAVLVSSSWFLLWYYCYMYV